MWLAAIIIPMVLVKRLPQCFIIFVIVNFWIQSRGTRFIPICPSNNILYMFEDILFSFSFTFKLFF